MRYDRGQITRKLPLFCIIALLLLLFIPPGPVLSSGSDENLPEPYITLEPCSKTSRFLSRNNFTIAVLPDSQYYSRSYPHIYTNQTWWLRNNSADLNIVYVLHEGDITNNNNFPQWTNANNSQRILDGYVPYTLCPGNHDLGPNGNAATRDTYMNDYFNITYYQSWPTFGGAFEPYKMENTYHLFSAGGIDWLIVSLEFAPRDAVVAWANQVVASYPDRITMMVTHNYLVGNVHNPTYGGTYGCTTDPAGAATGEDLWHNFVKKHRNILAVYCGHIIMEAGYLASTGVYGNTVHQMLANFQGLPNGGNGYLRLLEFDTASGTISVRTYSPYLDDYKTESQHQFTLNFNIWDYINNPPLIKNNVSSFELYEDDDKKYIDLNGDTNPATGIFSDPDAASGDKLTYYIWNGHHWSDYVDDGTFENDNLTVAIQDNDTLEITPKNDRYGSDVIKLKAADKLGNEVAHEITITINPVNDPPMINDTLDWIYYALAPTAISGKITCLEDHWANFTVTAYDPLDPMDNDNLMFSSNSSSDYAPFFDIDELTGNVSFLPVNKDVGIYFLKIMVDDGGEENNTYEYDFTLEVENTNDSPEIITVTIPDCYEKDLYNVEFQAQDIDPTKDSLVWEINTNSKFLYMDYFSGVLTGTPQNDDVGEYFLNVTVSDKKGGNDFANFTLLVINVNDPPFLKSPIPDFSFDEDTVDDHINLSEWFIDIDDELLGFRSYSSENVSISILNTGVVLINPSANWSGQGTLTFHANDSKAEARATVNFTVKPVNDPPIDPVIELATMDYYEKKPQPAIGNATDVDIPYGDELYFIWLSNITGELDWGREINLSLPAGFHEITLAVRDKAGEWTNTSVELRIHRLEESPVDDKDNGNGKKSTGDQDSSLYGIIAGIVIAIIVVIIILLLLLRRKKNEPSGVEIEPENGQI
ncbi:tandem-95 repeat protein [[Eubacterium] cellulosolvens]